MSVDCDVCKENTHVTANEQRNNYKSGNQPNQRLIIANMHNSIYSANLISFVSITMLDFTSFHKKMNASVSLAVSRKNTRLSNT